MWREKKHAHTVTQPGLKFPKKNKTKLKGHIIVRSDFNFQIEMVLKIVVVLNKGIQINIKIVTAATFKINSP